MSAAAAIAATSLVRARPAHGEFEHEATTLRGARRMFAPGRWLGDRRYQIRSLIRTPDIDGSLALVSSLDCFALYVESASEFFSD